MSAHEPRRESKVTPRRHSSQATAPVAGVQYDSDEVPVLFRLPDLSATAQNVELADPAPQRRFDRPEGKSAHGHSRGPHTRAKSQPTNLLNNKLLIGGALAGVAAVALLFFTNGSGTKKTDDETAWPSGEGESSQVAQDLQISIPESTESVPPSNFDFPPPALTDSNADPHAAGHAALASGHQTLDSTTASSQPTVGQSDQTTPWQPGQTAVTSPAADQTAAGPAVAWPDDSVMAGPAAAPANQGQTAPPTYQQRGTSQPLEPDYRSSMNTSSQEAYRTGRLTTPAPQSSARGTQNGVLDQTIEIPPQTRMR